MPAPPQPALAVPDEEVFLGEEIVFRAGLRSEVAVDALELARRTWELAVVAPGGAAWTHAREPSTYDGPARIPSLFYRECLKDEAFRTGTDPRWLPRERFALTVGLVLHELAPDVSRPIRWLRRARAEYDVAGALLATGEPDLRQWAGTQLSPSGS